MQDATRDFVMVALDDTVFKQHVVLCSHEAWHNAALIYRLPELTAGVSTEQHWVCTSFQYYVPANPCVTAAGACTSAAKRLPLPVGRTVMAGGEGGGGAGEGKGGGENTADEQVTVMSSALASCGARKAYNSASHI
jgi:hypothetical protein